MSTLTDLLAQFPHAKVTIRSGGAPRPKPREGQLRITKRYGRQIRRQQRAYGPGNRVIGYMVHNGRPRWEWVSESEFTEFELRCFAERRAQWGEQV
jgi:hypothetical protein